MLYAGGDAGGRLSQGWGGGVAQAAGMPNPQHTLPPFDVLHSSNQRGEAAILTHSLP